MTSTLEKELSHIANIMKQRGAKKYTKWSESLFQSIINRIQKSFQEKEKKLQDVKELWRAYLLCISEMIGCGYINESAISGDLTREGLMVYTFLFSIPHFLSENPKKKQLETIATAWNICEGLAQAPVWMQGVVAAKIEWKYGFLDLEAFLIDALTPALQETRPANWNNPCKLHILQSKEETSSKDFIPGHLHFVTPTVLCVHDHRKEDSHIGLFLKKDGKSQFIGETDCLGKTLEHKIQPTLQFEENSVIIEENPVSLDFLGKMEYYAISDAGFLVVTTPNSQQLWIVETA